MSKDKILNICIGIFAVLGIAAIVFLFIDPFKSANQNVTMPPAPAPVAEATEVDAPPVTDTEEVATEPVVTEAPAEVEGLVETEEPDTEGISIEADYGDDTEEDIESEEDTSEDEQVEANNSADNMTFIVSKATTTSINIRSLPDINSAVAGSIPAGGEGTVLALDEVGWTKIEYNGTVGYIYNKFIDVYDGDGNIVLITNN